jgi:hypothetical protein
MYSSNSLSSSSINDINFHVNGTVFHRNSIAAKILTDMGKYSEGGAGTLIRTKKLYINNNNNNNNMVFN